MSTVWNVVSWPTYMKGIVIHGSFVNQEDAINYAEYLQSGKNTATYSGVQVLPSEEMYFTEEYIKSPSKYGDEQETMDLPRSTD